MPSALHGLIPAMREGRLISGVAVDEIERVLDLLRAEGWTGFIPADEALELLLDKQLPRRRRTALAAQEQRLFTDD